MAEAVAVAAEIEAISSSALVYLKSCLNVPAGGL
jgi:hypothetical protein